MSNRKLKHITCYYWMDGDRCKNTAEECRFAHEMTGNVANPRKPGVARKPMLEPDLISLCSGKDGTSEKKTSHLRSPDPGHQRSGSFSGESPEASIADSLRRAIIHQKDFCYIRSLLTSAPASMVKESLSKSKHGVSAIFDAIEMGRSDILRLMIMYGADPNAKHSPTGIPVLAAAIFQNNASAVALVAILLELGADPFVIPKDLWDDNASLALSHVQDDPLKVGWCREPHRNLFAKCFNLSIRFYLQEAAKKALDPKSEVMHATGANMVNIELANHLFVGQEVALHLVEKYLRCHLLCENREPLVLAFVGPVGHGKTELARRIGAIRPLTFPSPKLAKSVGTPSVSSEEDETSGTFVNRALQDASNVNVICIDDLDKVDSQLLTPILDGTDKDLKNHTSSTKNVVIIFATRKEYTIDFYHHLQAALNNPQDSNLRETYESLVKKDILERSGHSIASRVACIIPFVPFSKKETALLAHKFILDAAEELTKSCFSVPGPNCGKHVSFTVDVAADVCQYLGESSYDVNFGARSIQQAVLSKVKLRMVEEYMKAYPSSMSVTERCRVNVNRPLNFIVRLNPNKSISVSLE
ncbi:hypothetical protein VTO42DRAFT_1167 [Malbranchea cinnamomea]